MKKFTLSIAAIMLFSMSLFAQNLIENPGFEVWNGTEFLDVWDYSGDEISVTKNTTTVHEGLASCQVLFTSDANQNLKSNTFNVTAGDPIAVSVWVYDNDNAGRARLTILFDGADNYYGNEYSEDIDAWQLLAYEGVVPDGATSATFQIRFYDVAANWDGNCEIIVDESAFIIDNEIKPEPSNYPTEFSASVNGIGALASWIDATGDQLPQNYLVMASATNEFTAPVDADPVDDDNDISDGTAVLNIAFGQQSASFSGFSAGATYYFTIYPYTNGGSDIDYKTDGEAPTAEITMPDVSVINYNDFEDLTFGDWSTMSVVGAQAWETMEYNSAKFAVISGYEDGAQDNEDWLISPSFNTESYHNVEFSFSNALGYSGPALQILLSQDYDGTSNPNEATWLDISEEYVFSDGNFSWVESGVYSLDLYSHPALYLAFKYTSNTDNAGKWEVDNLLLTGIMNDGVSDQELSSISVYPNPSHGIYQVENTASKAFEISVFNILGKQIMETVNTRGNYTLDISDFDNGVYFLQITSDNQKRTISLIKQ